MVCLCRGRERPALSSLISSACKEAIQFAYILGVLASDLFDGNDC